MTLPKVLLIEDEESTWKALSRCLANQASIIWTKKGKQALQILEKESIRMIFLSEFPEDIDGIALIKILKKKYPSIPIIFIASYLTVEKTIQIFKNGARELVQLPLKRDEIQKVYHRILDLISNQQSQIILPTNWPEKDDPTLRGGVSKLKNISKRIKIHSTKIQIHDILKKISNEIKHPFQSRKRCKRIDRSHGIHRASKIPTKKLKTNQTDVLRIYFLGKFQVYLNDCFISHWPSKKVRCLFAYLVLHHKRRIHRDVLMNIFWPNSTPESARNCLNVTMHSIRNIFYSAGLMTDIIQYQDERYFLNPEIELYTDFEDFRKRWQKAQVIENQKGINAALSYYENANKIYAGDFLQDEPFEELWESERENLREIHLVVLDKISECYSLDGKPDVAIKICQEILRIDNCREDIHQRLMKCYYRIGKRDKALRQFEKCVQIMRTILEVEPMKSTIKLFNAIKNDNLNELSNF